MSAAAPIRVAEIDAALAAAAPRLGADEQRLAVAVYRLLATGRPVTATAAAHCARVAPGEVERTWQSWPAVFFDDQHRVVGLWGLGLSVMPHRLRVENTEVFAWCAWDPLFLARVVGPMQVVTSDPVTNEPVRYRIGGDATITDASHPRPVLSFVRPDRRWDDDVMATFCHHIWQFSDQSAGEDWARQHPGTMVISLDDAVELARRHVRRTFNQVLGDEHG